MAPAPALTPVARWSQMAALGAAICNVLTELWNVVTSVSKPCQAWWLSLSDQVGSGGYPKTVTHVCVKMMSKGSKEALTVLIVTHVTQVERVKSGVCGFYATLHIELLNLLLMSKGLKVYSVYCGLSPLPGGKAIVWAFRLGGLAVHHLSVRGGSFIKFLGLVNYKGDCRQDAQPIPDS